MGNETTDNQTCVVHVDSTGLSESEIMEKTKRRIELVEEGQEKTNGSIGPIEMVNWKFAERLDEWLDDQLNLKLLLQLHIRDC